MSANVATNLVIAVLFCWFAIPVIKSWAGRNGDRKNACGSDVQSNFINSGGDIDVAGSGDDGTH